MFAYEFDIWSSNLHTDFTSKICLFKKTKLTKYANLDKYFYSGSGIGFDSRSYFWKNSNFNLCKNVIIFHLEISSLTHTANKQKKNLHFGLKPSQRLDDTTIRVEMKYSINFTATKRKFCTTAKVIVLLKVTLMANILINIKQRFQRWSNALSCALSLFPRILQLIT